MSPYNRMLSELTKLNTSPTFFVIFAGASAHARSICGSHDYIWHGKRWTWVDMASSPC